MKKTTSLIALTLGVGLITGCGPKKNPTPVDSTYTNPSNGIKSPVIPPIGPQRVNTPIDMSLRSRAISELSKAYASNDPVLRANAIEGTQRGLGQLGADRIKKALLDPSPLVRFAGSMAAGSLKLSDTKPVLLGMVNDNDANVQVGVRFALHQLGDHRYSHDLEDLALSTDPQVRANVVIALGLLGEPSALKILRSLEADRNNAVRLQLLEAEYRLGDPSAAERLYAGSISQFPDEQIICLLALGARRDPTMIRFLEGQLVADWPEVSLAAARSLGMVGADTGYGVAMKYAESNESRQRSMAAMAFGAIGRTDSQKHLSRLLSDGNPSVRLAAATAILQLRQ